MCQGMAPGVWPEAGGRARRPRSRSVARGRKYDVRSEKSWGAEEVVQTRRVLRATCEFTQVSESSGGKNYYPQSSERLMIYLRPHRRGREPGPLVPGDSAWATPPLRGSSVEFC